MLYPICWGKEVIEIQQLKKTEPTLSDFKTNIDSWIKDFNSRVTDMEEVADCFDEFKGNINHNYEISLDHKEKIDDLKQQIQTLKLTQLMIIKKVFAEDLALAGKNKDFLKKIMDDTSKSFE